MEKNALHKVTRFEVIDETGRGYVNHRAGAIEVSLQDDERTLKIFTKGRSNASPPTLHIGMGEEEIEAKAKEYSAELRSMLRHLGEQESTRHGSTAFFAYDSALRFANAYTKAVTMEAIVAECENQIEDDVEGWRSYDWEVFKKQLTARLLKLTQQP